MTAFGVLLRWCAPVPALAAMLALAGCGQAAGRPRWPVVGDRNAGKVAMARLGCGSCHMIPGVENADGLVGPSLAHFSRRTIVAGVLPNTPANLIHWIKAPQSVVPGNAMPDSGLTDAQASDIAAYLYALD